ncbi:MAG: peptide deformylase [Pseudomonadota bacterium]
MSILRIARMGHPVLRRVAEPLPPERLDDPDIQRLFDDMIETVRESEGAGLAAPQVYVPLRIIVLSADPEAGPMVVVNPEISFLSTNLVRSFEGCLSIPDLRAAVNRVSKVRVDGLDREGEAVSMDLEGFPAIAVQHECDHLDGVLFVDRCDLKTLAFMDELRRFGPLDPNFRRGGGPPEGDGGAGGDEEDTEPSEVPPGPAAGAPPDTASSSGWSSTPLMLGRGSPAEG